MSEGRFDPELIAASPLGADGPLLRAIRKFKSGNFIRYSCEYSFFAKQLAKQLGKTDEMARRFSVRDSMDVYVMKPNSTVERISMFDDRHNYVPAPKPKSKEIWLTVATLGLRALWRWYKGRKEA